LFEKIYKYFSTLKKSELSRNVSISTLLLESNIKVKYFKIEALNFKITYEYELDMYKKLLESK
jgi:2-C-methyl-D-erythritol 4-phosphate cytidylyltransferase